METAWVVLRQTGVMGLYMLAGFALFRTGWITKGGSKTLANVLIRLIIPCVILNGFAVARTSELLKRLFSSSVAIAVSVAISLLLSWLIYRKHPMDQYAASFANCGFIGIPIVRVLIGEEAVVLAVPFVVLMNVFQFLYGNLLFADKKKKQPLLALLLHPILICTALGLVLFFTGLGGHLPSVISDAVGGISQMVSPVAMVVLGVYLAQTDLRKLFTTPRIYAVSLVRLLVIPLVTIPFLWLIGSDHTVRLVVLLCGSASIGANIAVYAQLYDQDYAYACQAVALSTVLSIVTLPVLTVIAQLLPGF